MSLRTEKMLKKLKQKKHISIETYRILQETYRSMNGEPIVKCRAQAIYNILTQIPIYIDEGDLLAGNASSRPNGLEIDYANGVWDESEIKALREDGYTFDPEDELILHELNKKLTPYSINDGVAEILTEDSELMPFLHSGMGSAKWTSLERGRQGLQCTAQGGLNLSPARVLVCLDYETPLHKGLNKMIEECDAEIKKVRFNSKADYDRCIYLKAIKTCLKGIIAYAERMADLAGQEAEKEKDEKRKQELLQMAEICHWVPANPARNFREAIQMYWFLFLTVACPNSALGMGRLDQLLYPYYKQDIENGDITDEEVQELLEVLRIKDYQLGSVTSKDHRDRADGEAKWHNIIIGGVKKDGTDATNRLSYLILEALKSTRTLHPTITIRVADSTPDDLIRMGLECVRDGLSMPAFVGDKSGLAYLQRHNVSIEEARDYTLAGCLDIVLPGKARLLTCTMFMTPMCLDVFLNHGINRNNGEKLGHDYGDLDQWETYGDFEKAFKEEFKYFISVMTQYCNLTISSMQKNFPEPAKTAFMYRGIEDGIDYQEKRMPFENGGAICPVGMVNLGDSMMSIKKLVYDDKILKLSELKQAMDADWEGYEDLKKKCLNVSKYGNGIEEVDQIVADLYDYFEKVCSEMPCSCVEDSYYLPSAVSIFAHAPGGALTGATPDGRCCGETLADAGASPMRGKDVNGPLALIRSAIKIPHDKYQAVLFNMKFSPDSLKTRSDVDKLASLVRTYFDRGGRQVQFNIVDKKTLIDAKEHPENHQDLMVRVAGYSAYYVQLTDRLQNEILERTSNEKI